MVSSIQKTILIIHVLFSIFSIIKSEDEKPPCKTVKHCVYCPLIHQCEICEKEYSLNDDKSTCIYHMSHIYGLSKFGPIKNGEVKTATNRQVISNENQQKTEDIINDSVNEIREIKFILFKIILCVVLLVLSILFLIFICYIGLKKPYDLNERSFNAGKIKKVSIK